MKVPKLCKNPDGRAFSIYPGTRRRKYFGRYDDPETITRHEDWVVNLLAMKSASKPLQIGPVPRIVDLSLAYTAWAKSYYNGQGDWHNVRSTQALLNEFTGRVRGDSFGPARFEEFQRFLVGRGLSRSTINAHMGRARRFFRWCESRELIKAGHSASLATVAPLMPGRSAAAEPEPVTPVGWDVVARTLPHLPPIIADAVRVQYYCGMRPGEVLAMRSGEFDTSQSVWLWRPARHKNAHRLQPLTKAIPQAAQLVLAKRASSNGQLIFPAVELRQWKRSRQPQRKTKQFPCETAKLKGRKYRDEIDEGRYGKEIASAIERANSSVQDELEKIPHWTPNQLRHAIATAVSGLLGEQAASRYLGHARLETTSIYTASHERELIAIASQVELMIREQTPETPRSSPESESCD